MIELGSAIRPQFFQLWAADESQWAQRRPMGSQTKKHTTPIEFRLKDPLSARGRGWKSDIEASRLIIFSAGRAVQAIAV